MSLLNTSSSYNLTNSILDLVLQSTIKLFHPTEFLNNCFCQENKTNKKYKDTETSPRLKFSVQCTSLALKEKNFLAKLKKKIRVHQMEYVCLAKEPSPQRVSYNFPPTSPGKAHFSTTALTCKPHFQPL